MVCSSRFDVNFQIIRRAESACNLKITEAPLSRFIFVWNYQHLHTRRTGKRKQTRGERSWIECFSHYPSQVDSQRLIKRRHYAIQFPYPWLDFAGHKPLNAPDHRLPLADEIHFCSKFATEISMKDAESKDKDKNEKNPFQPVVTFQNFSPICFLPNRAPRSSLSHPRQAFIRGKTNLYQEYAEGWK